MKSTIRPVALGECQPGPTPAPSCPRRPPNLQHCQIASDLYSAKMRNASLTSWKIAKIGMVRTAVLGGRCEPRHSQSPKRLLSPKSSSPRSHSVCCGFDDSSLAECPSKRGPGSQSLFPAVGEIYTMAKAVRARLELVQACLADCERVEGDRSRKRSLSNRVD